MYTSYNQYSAAQGQTNMQQPPVENHFGAGAVPAEGSSLANQFGGVQQQQQFNQQNMNSNDDHDQMRQLQEQSEMEALEAQMLKEIMEQSMKDAE